MAAAVPQEDADGAGDGGGVRLASGRRPPPGPRPPRTCRGRRRDGRPGLRGRLRLRPLSPAAGRPDRARRPRPDPRRRSRGPRRRHVRRPDHRGRPHRPHQHLVRLRPRALHRPHPTRRPDRRLVPPGRPHGDRHPQRRPGPRTRSHRLHRHPQRRHNAAGRTRRHRDCPRGAAPRGPLGLGRHPGRLDRAQCRHQRRRGLLARLRVRRPQHPRRRDRQPPVVPPRPRRLARPRLPERRLPPHPAPAPAPGSNPDRGACRALHPPPPARAALHLADRPRPPHGPHPALRPARHRPRRRGSPAPGPPTRHTPPLSDRKGRGRREAAASVPTGARACPRPLCPPTVARQPCPPRRPPPAASSVRPGARECGPATPTPPAPTRTPGTAARRPRARAASVPCRRALSAR